MIIVADTTALNYLVLLGHIEILHRLYGEVVIPHAVQEEMLDGRAPSAVRLWAVTLPGWVNVVSARKLDLTLPEELGAGEREAISVALEVSADLLLMDDWTARSAAEERGLRVSGTVSVIARAAQRGWLDFDRTVEGLRRLGFRLSREVEAAIRKTLQARGQAS